MKFIQNVMNWGSTIISLAILAFQASVVHFHHVITAQDCYLDNPSLCKSRAVVLGCGFFGIFSKKHSPGVDFHLIFIHSLRLFNFSYISSLFSRSACDVILWRLAFHVHVFVLFLIAFSCFLVDVSLLWGCFRWNFTCLSVTSPFSWKFPYKNVPFIAFYRAVTSKH